ncbi:Oidioi.mRNA.OKI2018_I69.XSR.g14498.t1.cds [Oikopleura dioica]|uniref:glycerophosphodiester phosphodiesterase n=1 Tax=Oikopleura dioica TaxID=34765 RepID=A0ABN7SBS3_OIKDI|nr:Oidioi.mRNA.OKI2018_I69.XSR.g14498.t1.cds [Oikopleura dioica]
MEQRERLIPRFNRAQPASQCRAIICFSLVMAITISLVVIGLVLTGQASSASEMWKHHTRVCDSDKILNIAHRGSSGMRPAHSLAGYELAADQGADFIECDVAVTKDLKLVCLHDAFLSTVTNVAKKPEFEDRKRTLKYNGEEREDWWVNDFTFDELSSLRLIQEFADRDQSFNGDYTIPLLSEYIEIAQQKNVDIYPELKTPSFFNEQLNVDFEQNLSIQLRKVEGFDSRRVLVQSFDSTSLLKFHEYAPEYRLIQLAKVMPTDEQLETLAQAGAYGLGLAKDLIIQQKDNRRLGYSEIVSKAHSLDLKVHSWVSRNEGKYLLWEYGLDPYKEYEDLIAAGVDGIFTDFPASLANYLTLRRQKSC